MSPRTISVLGTPVRLHPPHGAAAQFPWASFADLLRVAEFPSEAVPFWADRWRRMHPTLWADAEHEMIVPESAGIGLFQSTAQAGWPLAWPALEEFVAGSRTFFLELHRDLETAEFRAVLNEALLRSVYSEVVH